MLFRSTPTDQSPGTTFSGASFGLLPQYLQAYGHQCEVGVRVDDEALRERDLVIIINPGRPFDEPTKALLLDFAADGNAILAMGDHTDAGGIMENMNALLLETGLALRFDSAVSVRHDWREAMKIAGPFSRRFDENDVWLGIGASVHCATNLLSSPLLTGVDAFADPGDRENLDSAFLGNLAYDRGERYGEIPLAVSTYYGTGRVVLFGDTSSLQNGALASSHEYVASLIGWITDGPPKWAALLRTLLGLILIPLALINIRRISNAPTLCLLAVGILIGSFVGNSILSSELAPLSPATTPHGIIDTSHGNLIERQPLSPTGIDALTIALARSGYLPVIADRTSSFPVKAGDLWVSIAATRPLTDSEADDLLEAIHAGATVVIGTRWPDAAAAARFLAPLGLDIANVPLGLVRPEVAGLASPPQLSTAWPLILGADWSAIASIEVGGERFAVVAERRWGNGSIVVVGDTSIFTNAQLEGKGYYYQENIDFLQWLLSKRSAG